MPVSFNTLFVGYCEKVVGTEYWPGTGRNPFFFYPGHQASHSIPLSSHVISMRSLRWRLQVGDMSLSHCSTHGNQTLKSPGPKSLRLHVGLLNFKTQYILYVFPVKKKTFVRQVGTRDAFLGRMCFVLFAACTGFSFVVESGRICSVKWGLLIFYKYKSKKLHRMDKEPKALKRCFT